MIGVEDLEFRYRPDREELFGGLSHQFRTGSMTAVTGASGRGKSTLLYVLGLMLTPTAGRVVLGDQAASALSDAQRSSIRARRIGFVFQDAELDSSRTVLDNVTEGGFYAGIPRRRAAEPARALLDRLGVTLREEHKPGEVSGGQAQRIGLCRALLKDPQLILADEPTGNLDSESSTVVLDELRSAAGRGATVIIASHDPRVIDRVDDVLAL